MGIDPVSLAIGGGLAATNAIAQGAAASQRNRQVKSQQRANNEAAQVRIAQEAEIARRSKKIYTREAARIRGLIAVQAAERGVGSGGSILALERQADFDARANRETAAANFFNAERRILSDVNQSNRALQAQSSNVVLSGLTGAAQGFQMGLSIGQSVDALTQPPTSYTNAPFAPGNRLDFDEFPDNGGDLLE